MTISTTCIGAFSEFENLSGVDRSQVACGSYMEHPTARYADNIAKIGGETGILFARAARHVIQGQSDVDIHIGTDDELCWIGVIGRLFDLRETQNYRSGRAQGECVTQNH